MAQLLLFRLGEQLCGLEVAHLQEIVEAPPIFYIPLAPACFCGAMNFHGQILPVLDLPAYLGLAGDLRDRRVVVLADQLCRLAFTATAVRRIVPYDPDALLPPPAAGNNPYIRCCCEREGETIHLLDAAALAASLETYDQRRN